MHEILKYFMLAEPYVIFGTGGNATHGAEAITASASAVATVATVAVSSSSAEIALAACSTIATVATAAVLGATAVLLVGYALLAVVPQALNYRLEKHGL